MSKKRFFGCFWNCQKPLVYYLKSSKAFSVILLLYYEHMNIEHTSKYIFTYTFSVSLLNVNNTYLTVIKRTNCYGFMKKDRHMNNVYRWTTGAVVQKCSIKKTFSKILQNSQENVCTSISFLIKLQVSGMQLY